MIAAREEGIADLRDNLTVRSSIYIKLLSYYHFHQKRHNKEGNLVSESCFNISSKKYIALFTG